MSFVLSVCGFQRGSVCVWGYIHAAELLMQCKSILPRCRCDVFDLMRVCVFVCIVRQQEGAAV